MGEVRLTWGQLKQIAEAMGLADDDPEPNAGMIIAWVEAGQIVDGAAAGLDGDGDDPQ